MAYENFYATTLEVQASASDTTLQVKKIPNTITSGWLTLEARNATNREIVWFSGVSGNILTGVVRGQQQTNAVFHAGGTSVEMNPTAKDFTDALAINSNIPQTLIDVFGDSAGKTTFAVKSGLVWTATTGLNAGMTTGFVYINGIKVSAPAITSKTFVASRDTYIDINTAGNPVYTDVALNAAMPTKGADVVRIARVSTNATTVTGIADIREQAVGAGGFEVLYSGTTTATTDSILTGSFPAKKNLMVVIDLVCIGSTAVFLRFNGDAGTNYGGRVSSNGAADATSVNQVGMGAGFNNSDTSKYLIANIRNDTGREKIMTATATSTSNGAGNVPNRQERAMKWSNTTAQITSIEVFNNDTGDFASGSSIIVFGKD